jgi:hypothetical protein
MVKILAKDERVVGAAAAAAASGGGSSSSSSSSNSSSSSSSKQQAAAAACHHGVALCVLQTSRLMHITKRLLLLTRPLFILLISGAHAHCCPPLLTPTNRRHATQRCSGATATRRRPRVLELRHGVCNCTLESKPPRITRSPGDSVVFSLLPLRRPHDDGEEHCCALRVPLHAVRGQDAALP